MKTKNDHPLDRSFKLLDIEFLSSAHFIYLVNIINSLQNMVSKATLFKLKALKSIYFYELLILFIYFFIIFWLY